MAGDPPMGHPNQQSPCPHCGYCPTCGRSNHSPYLYWPWWQWNHDRPWITYAVTGCSGLNTDNTYTYGNMTTGTSWPTDPPKCDHGGKA